MSSPLHFFDSQDEEEVQLEPVVSPTRPVPLAGSLQRIAKPVKGTPLDPESEGSTVFQGSPSLARRGVKTTPKARLRHDDSQIQFAAIESSPLQADPVESQYLTDRQKEVRERQGREAAAMFPEIRSSPRSTSRPTEYILPKLVFKSTQYPAPKSAIDEDTSPTDLPDALMDEFLGSSPTPSSKKSSDYHSNDDPPSSPPFISSHLQVNRLADAPLANQDQAPVQVTANADECTGNRFPEERPPSTKGHPSNGNFKGAVEDAPGPFNDLEGHLELKEPHAPVDAHPISDFDIYADAPSVPSVNQPSIERGDDQANDLMSSFQSEESSHFSVEDDQVTAQLITEMERASQQSATRDETAQPAREETTKRKRTDDSPSVKKKTKRTPAPIDHQAATETPRTGEMVAECVLIKVREADRSRPVPTQQIKRELSASPRPFRGIKGIEETPVAQKRPADHPKDSEPSPSSSQKQDTPTMVQKAPGRPRGSRNSEVISKDAEKEQARPLRKSTRVSECQSGCSTSSPHLSPAASQDSTKEGQWLALGKTPRRGMFRWLRRSSAESEDLGTDTDPTPTASSANEGNAEGIREQSQGQDLQRGGLLATDYHQEHDTTRHNEDNEIEAKQGDGEAQEAGVVVETEGDMPTAQGILQNFQKMLGKIKRVTFGPEEERAMVGILFESVKEVHEAGRRHISL